MSGIAVGRLKEERKDWRRNHPVGFWAKPDTEADGSMNMFKWTAGIPGKKNTDWEGGVYKVIMEFPEDYPARPPKCKFTPALFHPNVYPSGTVCLSILNEEEGWRPGINIRQILTGIQDLLDEPNPDSPAQSEAYNMYVRDKAKYKRRVQEEAMKYAP